MEREIEMEREAVVIGGGGGAVNSVNGMTGNVVLTTSDLENTSDYQTGTEVESAITTAIAGIDIPTKTSELTNDGATGTSTYVEATALTAETTARENADNGLQGQIDALSAASDVTDIVGTKAELNAYDTSKLKDNDIIKVLQDESEDDETTYYRWSTTTQSFTLIGEEGPYYTKAATDILLQGKQDTLTAGTNITIDSSDVISATDTTYTAGTGLDLTGTQFSIDNTVALKTDIPTVNDATLTITQNGTSVGTFTANDADDTTIALTDTTYSAFTGTDGTAAGTAGLVPAPATTDAGKFLKADGTWDTAGGGGPTVVQTIGTSTTDVMSQNATTSMVFKNGSGVYVQIGADANGSGLNCVAVGRYASASQNDSVAIGRNSSASATSATAVGRFASASGISSVAIGNYSSATQRGQMDIGATDGSAYNNSNYRLLTGLYDGQSDHDAVNLSQLNGRVKQNAGAPTTATVGAVGQLLEDTTNGKLYICTAIVPGTDPDPDTYTWTEVGAGGGGPTVVQTPGTSTTDVMSQNAVTSMIFADPATQYKIKIGAGTSTSEGTNAVEIGHSASATGQNGVAIGNTAAANTGSSISIGPNASAGSSGSVAIGNTANIKNSTAGSSVAIGTGAKASNYGTIALGSYSGGDNMAQGEMNIGTSSTVYGYNSSSYRLLTGLYDPQSAHDAATKGYVDPTTDSSAPTTATVGRLGQIFIDTANADAYMCVAVDAVTPSYTWKKINA